MMNVSKGRALIATVAVALTLPGCREDSEAPPQAPSPIGTSDTQSEEEDLKLLTRAQAIKQLQGDALYLQGRFSEAIVPYNAAYILAPNSRVAAHNLAMALLKSTEKSLEPKTIERAITLLNRALELPENHLSDDLVRENLEWAKSLNRQAGHGG